MLFDGGDPEGRCGRREKIAREGSERATGNPSRSYLRFSFICFFVEGNDRLRRGPSEHVHFFVNCGGFNDPKATELRDFNSTEMSPFTISSLLSCAKNSRLKNRASFLDISCDKSSP